MTRIQIKPLSVNKAWQGRRFKTPEYKEYQKHLTLMLPRLKIPVPPYEIYFKFGMSSLSSDWDNCIKTTQDILAKKYKFNDKLIRRGVVEIESVPKGKEFIEFELKTLV